MANLSILNEAIKAESIMSLVEGMESLVAIEFDDDDEKYRHNSFWSSEGYLHLCEGDGQRVQFILKFLESFLRMDNYISSEQELLNAFDTHECAFLGVNFEGLELNQNKCITDDETYSTFKNGLLENISFRNFWEKRVQLFPALIICTQVRQQVEQLGNSPSFYQIIDRLKTLNHICNGWKKGDFSYKLINDTSSLNISPESQSTMQQFGEERRFRMPNGGTQIFELHIKTGLFRFHFYPDNNTKKIYIGYIGPHLRTTRYK
ncbi:hypothetical protein [Fulvivirga ligni]|uniref:hypothetical protein n=1 Tax=Fulvivirga ligni TaxID=2904246 RepID=UPI001F277B5C|nr:hypothetical protein [Fulvivirga ligni]UII21654.1 hypothetical protein LVD16_00175 [Fulvivirga ligni]